MAFDIEKFPTSEAAQRMLSRVSPIYDNSYVGKWLFEVMGIEMDEARQLVESLRDQCFLERCTWGMRYWEERYGLTVDESADLETRRAACIAKRGKKQPMSPAALEDILEAVTGRGINITEDNGNYRFTVAIEEGDNVVDYDALITKLDTVKPSHLAYSFELPRKGTLYLYMAVASYQEKTITLTEYDETGLSETDILVDENQDYLTDEDGNILTDNG
ncbi:MAG: YmfQ family protein [Clostridia bacterium]|nr:YmfQ family protein [Clostridia bacterium]